MTEREYLRLKAEIQKQYEDELSALERIWARARQEAKPRQRRSPEPLPPAQPAARDTIGPVEATVVTSPIALVRGAVPSPGTDFTVRTIEANIHREHPEVNGSIALATISSTLKRMADNGEIRIKQPGRGKRATVYEASMR